MVDAPRIHPMELARPAIYALERANSEYSAGRMTIEVTQPDGQRWLGLSEQQLALR